VAGEAGVCPSKKHEYKEKVPNETSKGHKPEAGGRPDKFRALEAIPFGFA
jgi:hypothetical protein